MPFTSPSPIWRGSAWQPPTGICPGLRGVSAWPSPSFGPERGDRPLLEPDSIGRASLLDALQRPFVDLDRGQLLHLGDLSQRLRRRSLNNPRQDTRGDSTERSVMPGRRPARAPPPPASRRPCP